MKNDLKINIDIYYTMPDCDINEKTFKCKCGKSFDRLHNQQRHSNICKKLKEIETISDLDREKQLEYETIISQLRCELAEKDKQICVLTATIDTMKYMMSIPTANIPVVNTPVLNPPVVNTPVINAQVVNTPVEVVNPPVEEPKNKRQNPMKVLDDNHETAMDIKEFREKIDLIDSDIDENNFVSPVDWFCNIFDRNINNLFGNDISKRPFHVIRDKNSKTTSIFVKSKGSWTNEPDDIEWLLRHSRLGIKSFITETKKAEIELQYERDKNNGLIPTDGSFYQTNNKIIQTLFNYEMVIGQLSNENSAIIKHIKKTYLV